MGIEKLQNFSKNILPYLPSYNWISLLWSRYQYVSRQFAMKLQKADNYWKFYFVLINFFLALLFLVAPENVVVPIVSCIFGFPLLALLVICCLRKRAKLARERERQLNYGLQDHAVSLVRFSPIHNISK